MGLKWGGKLHGRWDRRKDGRWNGNGKMGEECYERCVGVGVARKWDLRGVNGKEKKCVTIRDEL